MSADGPAGDAAPRAVIRAAFGLLASLHGLGSARVSELQRDCGLPRTTVYRLLNQLQEVGAAERAGRPVAARSGPGHAYAA
jgi:IclR family transcriptional regulator, acetate operon repressor